MSKAHSTRTEQTQTTDVARTEDESGRAGGAADRTCPECGGGLHAEDGETVCNDCGLVVSEYRIDHGPEWRSFADDDRNPKRTGAPFTLAYDDQTITRHPSSVGRFSPPLS